ncbi:MAG: FAD-dependent oxidoreductase [Myxococcales bacterium]|nr:FAD-dependent oxidoreductase [Myxococcales bacterium]
MADPEVSEAETKTKTKTSPRPPLWFRLLFAVGGALVALLIAAVAIALWAWRYTEPTWLWPAVAAASTVALLVLLAPPTRRRLCARTYASLVRFRRGGALLLLSAAALMLVPLLRSPSAPPVAEPVARGEAIAVVGGGAAGVHATWMLLQAGHDVVLYEAANYIGGHAYSAPFETASGAIVDLDMGFLFGSPQGYQDLKVLMALVGAERVYGDVGFAAEVDGFAWNTDVEAARDPEIERFHRAIAGAYADDSLDFVPFGWWLRRHGFDATFRRRYLTPYLTLLFLNPDGFYNYSTRFMASMFDGPDKYLDLRAPWHAWSVAGGSARYYRALTEPFAARIRLGHPVVGVTRGPDGVTLTAVGPDGEAIEARYAAVILAIPPDVARTIVGDLSPFEDWVLAQVRYGSSEVILHTDTGALPPAAARRTYNWRQDAAWGDAFELSAELGPIVSPDVPLEPAAIGTLNPQRPIDGVRERKIWRHLVQDVWHFVAMFGPMPDLQGRGGIWYAGSWTSYIGHESAMRSGIQAACAAASLPAEVAASPGDECLKVQVKDAIPEVGVTAETVEICGASGAYAYLWRRHCSGD